MSKEHWTLLALFLGVIAAQLVTLKHGWSDALTPQFIGTTLAQIALLLRSFWTEKAQ